MKISLLIVFMVLLIGAIVSLTITDDQDLGDGYYYLPNYEAIDIGYPDGPIIYRSTQKRYFMEVIIKDNIHNVVSNRKYIVVYAKEKEKCSLSDSKRGNDRYYIINKKSGKVEGPIGNHEFLERVSELGVLKELGCVNESA